MTGGHPTRTRDSLVADAAELGVAWKRSVSPKVAVLICADPASQSGKARRARELGLPIVPYDWLLQGLEELQRRNRSDQPTWQAARRRRRSDASVDSLSGHRDSASVSR